jgi:hypothetical protein
MKLSFSAISTWVNCPQQFYQCYVLRKWYKETEQTQEGTRVHKEIEDYLKGKTKTPPARRPPDGLLDQLKAIPTLQVEARYAIDRQGRPTDYFGEDVVLRGNLDVVVEIGYDVWAIDWKTGKKRDNTLQAACYGLMLSAYYPDKRIAASFDYLEKGRCEPIVHDNFASDRVWRLVADIEADKDFNCKPSGLCGWCGVETCKHRR